MTDTTYMTHPRRMEYVVWQIQEKVKQFGITDEQAEAYRREEQAEFDAWLAGH